MRKERERLCMAQKKRRRFRVIRGTNMRPDKETIQTCAGLMTMDR